MEGISTTKALAKTGSFPAFSRGLSQDREMPAPQLEARATDRRIPRPAPPRPRQSGK
jgi:hypothetical protein